MPRLGRIYRRFVASARGVAAIEFAIILPVLVLLFLASVDAGRAIAIYMKVRSATYALDAIANQYTTIQSTDMTSIVGATAAVLAPYPSAPGVVTLSQISVNSSSSATVSWSYSLNGTALTQGAAVTVPAALASCGSYPCYLIFGQVSYTYTPLFGYFIKNAITLADSLYVTPRSSQCITYAPENVSSCAGSGGSSGSSGSGSSGSGSSGSGSSGSGSSGGGSGGSGGWFCFMWGWAC